MKKFLLLAGTALLAVSSMSAKTNFYPASERIMGESISVSNNGRYAVISDGEMGYGYLWDSSNPEVYTRIESKEYEKVQVYGVSDDCRIVGAVYLVGGYWRPAYRDGLDGEWIQLSIHPNSLNTCEAVAISNDGKYIAGYMMIKGNMEDPDSPIKGAMYPGQWTLNDSEEYELTTFTDFDTLGQQGFIPTCQSNDGRIIGGVINAGCSNAHLPALFIDGKFKMFDTVVYVEEPWYYKDKIMGYDDVSYIDGFKDDHSDYTFEGSFYTIDANNNLYGCRTTVENVNDNGEGTLIYQAAVYNVDTDEWFYDRSIGAYSCGYNREVMFCNGAEMVKDGVKSNIQKTLDFGADFQRDINAVMSMSGNTQVLGGTYQIVNPATMEYQYFPFMLTLDEPLVDISGIEIVGSDNNIAIVLSRGRIDIAGANESAVYDLNGRLIGRGDSVNVAPGTYVVKADNVSRTVMVK